VSVAEGVQKNDSRGTCVVVSCDGVSLTDVSLDFSLGEFSLDDFSLGDFSLGDFFFGVFSSSGDSMCEFGLPCFDPEELHNSNTSIKAKVGFKESWVSGVICRQIGQEILDSISITHFL